MPTPTYNALQHLIIAQRVCDYVGQKMTKGSPNKPIDMEHSRMRHESRMRNFKVYYDKLPLHLKLIVGQFPPKPDDLDLQDNMLRKQRCKDLCWSSNLFKWIMVKALLAEQSGIGNCTEQAAVGFRYLRNRTKCKVFTFVEAGLDHAFIVLGAGKNDVKGDYSPNKAPDWPANAVICDPWYNEWFIVEKHWCLKMRAILKLTEREEPDNERSLTTGVIPLRNAVQGTGIRVLEDHLINRPWHSHHDIAMFE